MFFIGCFAAVLLDEVPLINGFAIISTGAGVLGTLMTYTREGRSYDLF